MILRHDRDTLFTGLADFISGAIHSKQFETQVLEPAIRSEDDSVRQIALEYMEGLDGCGTYHFKRPDSVAPADDEPTRVLLFLAADHELTAARPYDTSARVVSMILLGLLLGVPWGCAILFRLPADFLFGLVIFTSLSLLPFLAAREPDPDSVSPHWPFANEADLAAAVCEFGPRVTAVYGRNLGRTLELQDG